MKKVLIINGSPKIEKSNSLILTKAFCEGLSEKENYNFTMIDIYSENIKHCTGCFKCWTKSPGKCIINDDMNNLIELYKNAEIVIWSFPLYSFGMPSKIKSFMDRLLPLNLPFISEAEDGTGFHPHRYDLSHQQHILISSCGFFMLKNNYESLISQFEIFTRKLKKPLVKIICPEGELLSVPALSNRCNQYLKIVKTAGNEFSITENISAQTQEQLKELLYPKKSFIKMANASWDISQETNTENQTEQNTEIERFVTQMAATYNPASYKKKVVIELNFTDKNQMFQLHLGKENCIVKKAGNEKPNTTITTTFTVWKNISDGKIGGAEAMMKGLYKVTGDFETMKKMDSYFGTNASHNNSNNSTVEQNLPKTKKLKKTNMLFLLTPWIVLWIFLPIDSKTKIGAAIAISICALFSSMGIIVKMTPYDKISASIVSIFSLILFFVKPFPLLIASTYFLFGLIWFISAFTKIPLTAHYSCNDNGGEKAFQNPLFMKTNKILTMAWGVLYLITGIAAYFLLTSFLKEYTGLIMQVTPFLMGLFTKWFQNWYPAKVARGE